MIDKLTPEQEAMLPKYYQMGLDIGYRTEPIDQAMATECIKEVHEFLDQTGVPNIVFVQSPMEAQLKYNELKMATEGLDPNSKKEYNDQYWVFNWFVAYYVFYLFLRNELMPEKKNDFPVLDQVIKWSKNLHYVISYGDTYFVSNFPSEISVDEEGKMDNKYGPGVSYSGDWAIYALEGETLSKEDWLEKTKPFHSPLAKEIFKKL